MVVAGMDKVQGRVARFEAVDNLCWRLNFAVLAEAEADEIRDDLGGLWLGAVIALYGT
jgi:hypothetical protein